MEQVGRSLDHFLDKVGLKKQINLRQFFTYWPKVVGNQIKNHTRPITLKENILWVEVSDSTWLYHLTIIKSKIITDFNNKAGKNIIKDIKFINNDFCSKFLKAEVKEKLEQKQNFNLQNAAYLIKEKDREKLVKAVQQSPPFFQPLLEKIFQRCYLQQRLKEVKGARTCQNCHIYIWDHEIKEGLCPCCYTLVESWWRIFKILFYREPWLRYKDIVLIYPSLSFNTYQFCKKKFLIEYSNRIVKIMEKGGLEEKLKRKTLLNLAQRYVMLSEEKKPEEIESYHVFNTLKTFPGLYQYLYEHYNSEDSNT